MLYSLQRTQADRSHQALPPMFSMIFTKDGDTHDVPSRIHSRRVPYLTRPRSHRVHLETAVIHMEKAEEGELTWHIGIAAQWSGAKHGRNKRPPPLQ